MMKVEIKKQEYEPNKPTLININHIFEDGMIYGVIGRNGAGKTTLFNCLCNMISYDGLIKASPTLRVGYLPTTLYFYPNIKGIEHIEFCLAARKIPINYKKIEELNELFDLPLNKYVHTYSMGMQKKIAILSLILQQNSLFILDEPFNGLDLSTTIMLEKILERLQEKGKTVIMSSHILHSLINICDQICYLNNGTFERIYYPVDYSVIESIFVTETIIKKLNDLDL